MIFSTLLLGAIFLTFMRLLPWVAKRHPRSRNSAALFAVSLAAYGAAKTFTLVAASTRPELRPDAPFLHALLSAAFAFAMHFVGSATATSLHVVYLPFLAFSLFALAGGFSPFSGFVSVGMLALAGIAAWQKHRAQVGVADQASRA